MALTDNLISYWKFEGNSNDSIGANNGTDTTVSYNSSYGKIGQGVNTNGTLSNGINFGNNSILNSNGCL